ncbi:hypothetical protein O9992_25785 [Vibrio lentus]|nr:hypothetical protein [Vibrio lentus]
MPECVSVPTLLNSVPFSGAWKEIEFIVEITEHSTHVCWQVIDNIKVKLKLGITIALDDFGTVEQ